MVLRRSRTIMRAKPPSHHVINSPKPTAAGIPSQRSRGAMFGPEIDCPPEENRVPEEPPEPPEEPEEPEEPEPDDEPDENEWPPAGRAAATPVASVPLASHRRQTR